jgi:hypothetical protein
MANGTAAFTTLRRAVLIDGAVTYVRTPADGMHAYFTGSDSALAACPATTWNSGQQAATSSPHPPRLNGKAYRLIARPGGRGTLEWDAVTRFLEPH